VHLVHLGYPFDFTDFAYIIDLCGTLVDRLFPRRRDSSIDYELIRSRRKTISAEIRGGHLLIRAPKQSSEDEIEAFLRRHRAWIESHLAKVQARREALAEPVKLTPEELDRLTEQAKLLIPQRVAYYAPLVGVDYSRITIRRQHTRWGSCSSKGNLSFNCLLMLTPPEVLDGVVVHELCHRRQMNHSARFYAELARVYPAYPQCRRWLKENGAYLLDRL